MQQTHMRIADRWLGMTVCLLLTLHRRLTDLWRGADREPPRRILFIKLIEQGATVIAYDAIKRAVQAVGAENVFFLVFPENRAIVDLVEVLPKDNVITLRHRRPLDFFVDLAKFLVRCRRERIDATIDMEFFARAPAILAYLSGARTRVGLFRFTSEAPYRGDLMTRRVPHNPHIHTAVAYRALVEACFMEPGHHPLLGFDTDSVKVELPRFRATDAERQRVLGVMSETLGQRPGWPIVLLNPNAGDLLPLRKWSTERFRELAAEVLAAYPAAAVYVTGAPSERADAEAFARSVGSDRIASLAGHTSLRELFVLYELADVLVTNDSGPGHFSTMTDIHSVVLFGPETPLLFGPLGKNSRTIWKRYSCSPCVNASNHRESPCNKNSCMQAIEVDEVMALVAACIEERRPSRPGSDERPTPVTDSAASTSASKYSARRQGVRL